MCDWMHHKRVGLVGGNDNMELGRLLVAFIEDMLTSSEPSSYVVLYCAVMTHRVHVAVLWMPEKPKVSPRLIVAICESSVINLVTVKVVGGKDLF